MMKPHETNRTDIELLNELFFTFFLRFAFSCMSQNFFINKICLFTECSVKTFGVYSLNFSWLTIWNFSWLPNAVHWNLPRWFARSLPVGFLEDISLYLIGCFSVQLHHAFVCHHQSPVIHIILSNLIIFMHTHFDWKRNIF